MLGGDVVFAFIFYLCFLFHIWYIDFDLYYEIIHGICLYCVLCEIKNLFFFTCIFHTCIYAFVEYFRKYTGWFSRVALYTCN